MKKLIALVLALTMVFALCACAAAEADNEAKEEIKEETKEEVKEEVKEETKEETKSLPTVSEGKLCMATEATFPPYEFYDGDKLVGIDVEVAGAIAAKLGLELEVTDIAFDSIIPGVQTAKYDIGMAGMTVTEERLEEVNFTTSYATGVQVVIVKDGSPITTVDDLFGDGNYTIGTQTGTTGFLYATWDIEDEGLGTVKSFAKTTDAIEALKNGQVDCVLLDNEPAKALVAANNGLSILDSEYAVEDYAIAMSKDNAELLAAVDGALKELIDDGTLKSIIDKYIG